MTCHPSMKNKEFARATEVTAHRGQFLAGFRKAENKKANTKRLLASARALKISVPELCGRQMREVNQIIKEQRAIDYRDPRRHSR
jgi:hypothetical protein